MVVDDSTGYFSRIFIHRTGIVESTGLLWII